MMELPHMDLNLGKSCIQAVYIYLASQNLNAQNIVSGLEHRRNGPTIVRFWSKSS